MALYPGTMIPYDPYSFLWDQPIYPLVDQSPFDLWLPQPGLPRPTGIPFSQPPLPREDMMTPSPTYPYPPDEGPGPPVSFGPNPEQQDVMMPPVQAGNALMGGGAQPMPSGGALTGGTPPPTPTMQAAGISPEMILAQMSQLQQQPLLKGGMAQVGSVLAGMGAGWFGKENPVLGQAIEQRRGEAATLQGMGNLALGITSREEARIRLGLEQQRVGLEERRLKMTAEEQAKDNARQVYLNLYQHGDEAARKFAITGLQTQGIVPKDASIAELAAEPNFGFGKSAFGEKAAAIWIEGQGKVSKEQAKLYAAKTQNDAGTTQTLAAFIQQDREFITYLEDSPLRNMGYPIQWASIQDPEMKGRILARAEEKYAAQQGFIREAEARATKQVQATSPLTIATPDRYFIDKSTGKPVDKMTTTLQDLQGMGGSKRFAEMDPKQFQSWQGVQESKNIIGEFLQIIPKLTKTPGANFGQALSFYALTKFGVPNPGLSLEALDGAVLRFAGALQGSRAQLSDKDVASIRGLMPKTTDTVQSGLVKMDMALKLFESGEKVLTGAVDANEVRGLLNKIKAQSLPANSRAVRDKSGQLFVIPKSAPLPQGYEELE